MTLVLILQRHGRVTAAELAQRLEVSPRTVRRLRAARAPHPGAGRRHTVAPTATAAEAATTRNRTHLTRRPAEGGLARTPPATPRGTCRATGQARVAPGDVPSPFPRRRSGRGAVARAARQGPATCRPARARCGAGPPHRAAVPRSLAGVSAAAAPPASPAREGPRARWTAMAGAAGVRCAVAGDARPGRSVADAWELRYRRIRQTSLRPDHQHYNAHRPHRAPRLKPPLQQAGLDRKSV